MTHIVGAVVSVIVKVEQSPGCSCRHSTATDVDATCRHLSAVPACVTYAGFVDQSQPPTLRLDDIVVREAVSCRCFMFRAWRRAALTRRLAKRRVDSGSDVLASSSYGGTDVSDDINQLYSIVGQFDDRQLEALAEAVENGQTGGRVSECIVPVAAPSHSQTLPSHIICCRLWRWPTLDRSVPIKSMPWCQAAADCDDMAKTSQQNGQQFCCNPYHWSRLILPDFPPPPYSKAIADASFVISSEDSSQWLQKFLLSDSHVDNKNMDVNSLAGG